MTTNPYESPENPESGNPPQHKSNLPPSDWLATTLRLLALLGLLGLLLLVFMPRWPLGGARESARRAQCANNLKNIALALQNYETAYHSLPPAYTVDAAGKPLHSWRTLILPFIEHKSLYDKIDLTKPWDDPENQQAFKTIVRLYECPSNTLPRDQTTYLAVVSPGGCFEPAGSTPFTAIKDRRDLTLLVIEVSNKHSINWM